MASGTSAGAEDWRQAPFICRFLLRTSMEEKPSPRSRRLALSGTTRTSRPSSSSSTGLSIYSLSFLAIAVLSLAQLRGVYQSSRGATTIMSSSSSSSLLASSGRPDPYDVTVVGHLRSAAIAAAAASTTTTSLEAGMSPASADGTGAIHSAVAAGTAKEADELNSDATSRFHANEADEMAGETQSSVEPPSASADEKAARLRSVSATKTSAQEEEEGRLFDPADQMADDAEEDTAAAAGIRSDENANDGLLGEPFEASTKVINALDERSFEFPSDETTRDVLDTSMSSSLLPPPTTPTGGTHNRSPLYSVARTDRAGATIRDMVLALAYGYAHNRTYGGACYVQPMRDAERRQADKEALIRAIGLQDVLTFACPDSFDEPLLQQDDFFKYRFKLMSPRFLRWLRSKVKFPPPSSSGTEGGGGGKPHAVVHVRRGDVDPCREWAKRYLPNSYYQEVIRKYVPADASVTIYSESFSFEPWDEFNKTKRYTLQLDTDLADVWRAIMSAQYVVLSLSSFAYIPAVLNAKATVLFSPTWQMVPMSHWVKVGHDIRRRSNQQVRKLADAKCKTHTSLRPGTSLLVQRNFTADQTKEGRR
jgi:hypothetical protein